LAHWLPKISDQQPPTANM